MDSLETSKPVEHLIAILTTSPFSAHFFPPFLASIGRILAKPFAWSCAVKKYFRQMQKEQKSLDL